MEVDLKGIKLFENMSQIELNEGYYDLHNDYNCVTILYENNSLTLRFKHVITSSFISLCFGDTYVTSFELNNSSTPETVDNLYKGRYEANNQLNELSSDGKFYFYLEFDEGHKIEFFSKYLVVNLI